MVWVLSGCESIGYYSQSVRGHAALQAAATPINDLLDHQSTPASLKQRLQLALDIRQFASTDLGLPDNNSYTQYSDIGRDAVLWSVIAVPEFSLTAKTWCYPVIGCASYRGYFDQAAADEKAALLRKTGYDVFVSAVPAYSTLGWFDDPIPSSVVYWRDAQLADLVFHELAHQKLYINDDSAFNEAFATAVGRIGTQRWLSARSEPVAWQRYQQSLREEAAFIGLLRETRVVLADLYALPVPEAEKRQRKQAAFAQLKARYEASRARLGFTGAYDTWFDLPMNNARLALVATYHDWVPAIEKLYQQNGSDMTAFYQAISALSQQPRAEREAALKLLMKKAESVPL